MKISPSMTSKMYVEINRIKKETGHVTYLTDLETWHKVVQLWNDSKTIEEFKREYKIMMGW